MNKTNVACAALAIAVTSVVVPAAVSAKEPITVTGEVVPTRIVSYADLDLKQDDGVKSLHGRVRRAATDLCVAPGPQPLQSLALDFECRNAAIAGAQSQIVEAIDRFGRQNYAAAQTITVTLK